MLKLNKLLKLCKNHDLFTTQKKLSSKKLRLLLVGAIRKWLCKLACCSAGTVNLTLKEFMSLDNLADAHIFLRLSVELSTGLPYNFLT